MTPEDANELFLSTDYPMDKILETLSGSFTASARYGAFQPRRSEETITHNIGSYALPNGVYSFDNSTWYPLGVRIADTSGGNPSFQTVEVTAYCTDSLLVVQASNYLASSRTVYYAIQLVSRD